MVLKQKMQYILGRGKLPDFLIIGAQKCGTTSLWWHLKKHPDIEMSPNFMEKYSWGHKNKKEVHFFDSKFYKGLRWYKSLFNNNEKLQGEATPKYLRWLQAPERMFNIIPNAKLILLLRDPVTRAYSSFNHIKQLNVNWYGYSPDKNFEYNLREIDIKENFQNGVVMMGFYIDQIERFLNFYPREQMLILISEKFRKNPRKTHHKILEFLNVKFVDLPTPQRHKREYNEPLDKKTEKLLSHIYKPYNERLYDFLGNRIPEWEIY